MLANVEDFSNLLRRKARGLFNNIFIALMLSSSAAAQLAFLHAVDLASQKSASRELAALNRRGAYLNYLEARSGSLPPITTGFFIAHTSGLAIYTGGSFTSIVNLSAQQAIFDPSHNFFIDSARNMAPSSGKFQRTQAMLECAIAYVELVKATLQREVLLRQQRTAGKLLYVESQRTFYEIDDVATLTRAKLANAHTQMRAAELDVSRRELIRQLTVLTGLTEGEIEPSADSIPPLSVQPASDISQKDDFQIDLAQIARAYRADISATAEHEMSPVESEISNATREALEGTEKEMQFARDAAQLDYMLARIDTLKAEMGAEVGKTSLGSLQVSYITEDEKLNALLEANASLQVVQLQLLHANRGLESWLSSAKTQESDIDLASLGSGPESYSKPPRSILTTPNFTTMTVGQSRQLSAFFVYGDASVRNAEVTWQSSSNWNCIVSSSGLVTALAPGEVIITATGPGVITSRGISITSNITPR
jgi:hypothetical protein